jgi:hypothetical protein
MISKMEAVLNRDVDFPLTWAKDSPDEAEIGFFMLNEDDSEQGFLRTVYLGWNDWTELGSPDIITMSIRPGNHLE